MYRIGIDLHRAQDFPKGLLREMIGTLGNIHFHQEVSPHQQKLLIAVFVYLAAVQESYPVHHITASGIYNGDIRGETYEEPRPGIVQSEVLHGHVGASRQDDKSRIDGYGNSCSLMIIAHRSTIHEVGNVDDMGPVLEVIGSDINARSFECVLKK